MSGNTAPGWRDSSGSRLALAASAGSSAPRWDEFGPGGVPALHFDGDDGLRRFDGMPQGDYTKVVVVTLDDYGAPNNLLSGSGGHALWYASSDRAQLWHLGESFVTSSVPTPLGVPTILIATYDSELRMGRLYQDGAAVGSGFADPHGDPGLHVGSFAGGNFMTGSLSEVRLYDRVLSADERQRLVKLLAARYQGEAPEVDFDALPKHAQVVQRDELDRAVVPVAGWVRSPGYESIELSVLRDGLPWSTTSQALVESPWGAEFALNVELEAGLHDYELQVRLHDAQGSALVARVEDVACGDTLLLCGQSNTVAPDFWSEDLANQSQSPWIRSYGSSLSDAQAELDHNWGQADGELGQAHCAIGSWALRAAELLLLQEQMPLGLINGAVGGTAIHEHLRNDEFPEDPHTIYGRLLSRARAAQVDGGARAMLWYQGESDGEAVGAYALQFQTLYDAWHLDYPALEKVYLFQVRKGCGVLESGVREFQRTAPDFYPDVEVMSTTAAPSHDGCHYFYAGYRELGDRIARVLARDLYGSLDTHEIDPPNISSAQLVGELGDALLLTFRDPDDSLVFEPGAEAHFVLDDGVAVSAGSVLGNTITLQLEGPTTATTISYIGHPADGPWVKNGRGVGALAFFDVPIAP